MKYYYHATPIENVRSINKDGLRPGPLGLVFLAESPAEAMRFPAIERGPGEYMVYKVKITKDDEKNVSESFDHCFEFWKCRCFCHNGAIPPDKVEMHEYYDLKDLLTKGGD